MRAMNLYLLTREAGSENFSAIVQELTGRTGYKEYSRHEAQSLRALTQLLTPFLIRKTAGGNRNWVSCLDGFYYSYTIAHISKEFDLLKISADGNCVLNIELKSEAIEEERILRQLTQNRYYLTHISRTIYSYTYVMETNTVYYLNDKGHMRACDPESLAEVLCKPVFSEYVEKDLDLYFRASDYLIAPVDVPDKFLQGNYFLTNQQSEFKRRILEILRNSDGSQGLPFIVVTGGAGTGKTLLLFDLALDLSRKKKVLILHGGKLQEGHRIIDKRLKNVEIQTADELDVRDARSGGFSYVLFDEAGRVSPEVMARVTRYLKEEKIPCVAAYDQHIPVRHLADRTRTVEMVSSLQTMSMELTGNIRINRPVYLFLRALFTPREIKNHADYDCIEVLFAADRGEALAILAYYMEKGYHKIVFSREGENTEDVMNADEVAEQYYDRLMVVLDPRFYYNEDMHLSARGEDSEEALSLLYEGISRTREGLCLLVVEDQELFTQILSIRGK